MRTLSPFSSKAPARTIAFIASMAAFANVVSLYSVPISIIGFQSRIHFQQLPIILGGVVAGAAIGLVIGFFGAFMMAYFAGIPFILGGMALLGLLSGLFARRVRPLLAGVLAYLTIMPYVAFTDYVWGLPLPVIGAILIKLGIEAFLCSIIAEAVCRHRTTATFLSSLQLEGGARAEKLIRRLEEEQKALIIIKNGRTIYSSPESGLGGILRAIDEVDAASLKDTVVLDRVVGKAAALVATYFGAREVHARIISGAAIDALNNHSVAFSYLQLVDEIKDRSGLRICRFEEIVSEVDDPKEAVRLLRQALDRSSG